MFGVYLYLAGRGNFLDFCEKVEIVKKINQIPNGHCVDIMYRNKVMPIRMLSLSLFQILSKSVKGFSSCEGPNWGSSIDFNSRSYNRSALPCCL